MAHAAFGVALARGIRRRRTAALAAVASHALLDLPRHEDLGMRSEGALTLATIGLTGRLFGVRSREFWCAFLSCSPDLEHVIGGRRRRLYPTHRFSSLHESVPTPRLGAGVQATVAVASLLVLARAGRRP